MLIMDGNTAERTREAFSEFLDGLDARVSRLEMGLLVEVQELRDENARLRDENANLETKVSEASASLVRASPSTDGSAVDILLETLRPAGP